MVKKSHHIILADDGDICIGEVPEVSKIIKSPPSWVSNVLQKLDGTRTVPRIGKELGHEGIELSEEDLYGFISEMDKQGLLEDNTYFSSKLSSEEVERYDRQILQFSLINKENIHPLKYQERLKDSVVAVFGMGGWGTWCSLQLALSGIGRLKLIDGDDVELSNINRQVLYNNSDIGKNKVDAAKARIKEYNPNVEVETFFEFATTDKERLEKLLEGVSFIVLAWASLGYYRKNTPEEIIHNIAESRSIPIIELGGDPLDISVGPVFLNDGSHCSFQETKKPAKDNFYSKSQDIEKFQRARIKHNFIDGERKVNAWQSSPSLSAMSGLACDQIIKAITNYDDSCLIGKRFFLSLRTHQTREEKVFENAPG